MLRYVSLYGVTTLGKRTRLGKLKLTSQMLIFQAEPMFSCLGDSAEIVEAWQSKKTGLNL